MAKTFTCSICEHEVTEDWGHNPEPFPGDRCCSDCNDRIVIPARMMFGRNADPLDIEPFKRFVLLGASVAKMNEIALTAWKRQQEERRREGTS